MNKKIILALFFCVSSVLAQTGASFKFGDVGSWWIPKFQPFGTSTTLVDSTNYVTINKSFYILDSLKVAKDIYLVNGTFYLDTGRTARILSVGSGMSTILTAPNARMEYTVSYGSSKYRWNRTYDASGLTHVIADLDSTTGLLLYTGNIQLYGGTQQIKLPSDTATDYDANDAITLNRQSGTLTTKSLTTTSDNFYTFTFTNSLISATSKVFVSYCGGTESAGRPTVYRVTSGSGSATIILLNLAGASSFNGNVKLNFVLFN